MATDQTARRTQAERSADTRARLINATIESLLDAGYVATTTRRVTELAGVSQGAQTHHFPRRVDLVASAFESLAQRRLETIGEQVAALPTDDPVARRRAVLDLLWEDFASDLFKVAVKLWVAAADDDELRERLIPSEQFVRRTMREVALRAIGDDEESLKLIGYLPVVINTAAGLALAIAFDPTQRVEPATAWPLHRAALEKMLEE